MRGIDITRCGRWCGAQRRGGVGSWSTTNWAEYMGGLLLNFICRGLL